jgi:adenine deaminase
VSFPLALKLASEPKRSLPKLAVKPWILAPPDDLILINALVVQPSTGTILDGKQTITIQKGMIVSVKPTEGSQTDDPDSEVRTVDLNGAYVCP